MIQDGPLDELAARLVVPGRSGIYLTKSELISLARATEGSLRISERKRMLADVLKSPPSLAELADLVLDLRELTQGHLMHYRELIQAYPGLQRPLSGWCDRAERTVDQLEQLREEILAELEET